MKTHKFFKADDDSWMVRCLNTGGEFSTAVWRLGKVKDQECPCCGRSVKEDQTKSDEELREENERRFGEAAVTAGFHKPLDFITNFKGEER